MTEQDWLSGVEPRKLLQFLSKQDPGSKRKPRLFSCACCRQIWHLVPHERSRSAVEMAERYADGRASNYALRRAQLDALKVDPSGLDEATDAVSNAAEHVPETEWACAESTAEKALFAVTGASRERIEEAKAAQVTILKDIFTNPFRPTPSIDPTWRRWHDATIPRLAQQMYDTRDFAAMPILADALEEAGCSSGDILEHCRGQRPHVRGCWVVDLILGKE